VILSPYRLAETTAARNPDAQAVRSVESKKHSSPLQRPRQNMSRRKSTILVALVILLAVGAELAIRLWHSAKGCVQVVNEGDAPMDDLVVSYAETKVALGRLGAGQSAKAWFTAGERGALTLDFKQKDNPLRSFRVPDFDPVESTSNGFKLVLVVKSNRVERFMEDDEDTTSVQNLSDRIRDWMRP
jgi:hypothetical protein